MSSSRKGYLYSLTAAVIFGTMPLCLQFASDLGVPTFTLLAYKSILGLPVLLVAMKFGEKRPLFPLAGKDFWQVFLLSALGMPLTLSLLMYAYDLIGTGAATSLHFSYPVFVLLFSRVLYRDKIKRSTAVCFVLCLLGIAALYTPASGGGSPLGSALALISGLSWGLYTLWLDKFGVAGRMGDLRFLFFVNVFASVMFLILSIVSGQFSAAYSPGTYAVLLLTGVLNGVLPVFLFQKGIRLSGARSASLIGTLEPVTSIVLGALVLKEALTLRSTVGVVLILSASVALILSSDKEAETAASR